MAKRTQLFHLVVISIVISSYLFNSYVKMNKSEVASPVPDAKNVKAAPTPSPDTNQAVLGLTTAPDKEATVSANRVIKVVDGDTIKVDVNGVTETVRLIGVDTPETVDPRKPVQCFGKQASDETKHLLEGQLVNLVSDPTQTNRDKYQRLLRYVYLTDGTDVGQLLISEGFAHEYTYKVPYQHQQIYKEDQNTAAAAKRGLWADGVCTP